MLDLTNACATYQHARYGLGANDKWGLSAQAPQPEWAYRLSLRSTPADGSSSSDLLDDAASQSKERTKIGTVQLHYLLMGTE